MLTAAALAAVLSGCGAEPDVPETMKTAEVRAAALDRLTAVEQAADAVPARALRDLVTALASLRSRMTADKVGTAAQRDGLADLIDRLARLAAARSTPPPDWRPGDASTAGEATIDAAPLRDVLPELRTLIQSIE